jgi:iron complex outermembrane receptor protein
MPGDRLPAAVAVAVSLPAALCFDIAQAQMSTDETAQVVITGTRVQNRSALETAVPVDVISSDSFRNRGVPEISQVLSDSLPSYNYPRPGLSDASDTVRPATLRGLSPDETLVLVNGKRRQSAALVNVNATIGRGATSVDLNTLPDSIVRSVEVLRDGASAQYGSDAIAGVIDVRLREERDGGDATASYGVHKTTYEFPVGKPPAGATWSAPSTMSRSRTDGGILTVSAWKGLPLGPSGFLTIAAEFKNQAHTERTGYDVARQYPLVNGAFDPREQTFNRFDGWYGEPKINQKTVFANLGYELADGAKLYGWASYQDRNALSAGFYRRAGDDRNVISIFPDGFLPLEAPEVKDYSGAGGVTWSLSEWTMDTSLVYGLNKMHFTIENTLNRSQGALSKTVFDAGGFDYDQLVFNFSGVRGFDMGMATPLNVALGLEARRESYSITAGEPDSYVNGGELLRGLPTPSGSQVFPGFRPANAVDKSRTAVGVYADLETRITEKLLASAALREERYSDFGTDLTGKLALRYDFAQPFALRGSVQNGFRAPSLQQQYFATTSTNFILVNGVSTPFDVTTFPATDPVAAALGARPLTAEKSVNYSVGAVVRVEKLNVTVDAYRIDITNRIILSENLIADNVRNYLTSLGFVGVGGGRFFINGVDTRTKGVDIAATYPFELSVAGRLNLTLAGNFNSTDVTRVPTTSPRLGLNPPPVLFDRFNVLTLEEGTPKNKFIATGNWSLGQWGATARATRYGRVLSPGSGVTYAQVAAGQPTNDVELHAKTLVDLEGRVEFFRHATLALGAENVFDTYPDPNPAAINTTGTTAFSNYSPFGRAGRFIYGRLSYDF